MKTRIGILIFTMVVVCLFSNSVVAVSSPLDAIKGPIDQVILILNDPVYKDGGLRVQQREKIWGTIKVIFDFNEISKRTLARNIKIFSKEERTAFSAVFSEFLGNTYVDKIQGEYSNEKIIYVSQEIIKETKALTKTKILRETLEIPVDYRLKLIRGQWKVYDIIVEGVSLVKNYRIQFNKILKKETPAQLIERLDKKLKRQKEKLVEPAKDV